MNATDIPLEERIIFALDVADPREALALVDQLSGSIRFFKVGLQLFFAGGWPVVEHIVRKGCKVMLDLKLYDIPATVQLAVRQFADRGITFTTVHGYGPVVEAALAADTGIQILAVTVLTSFGAEQVNELQFQGSVDDLVLRRAETVLGLGCHGVVCSAREAMLLRGQLGQDFVMVTPGIRPAGAALNDQQRVATPGRAIADGADYLVIGRPIRDAADPEACIRAIQHEIATALA
ncbi:orotidine-5'-phosphate decarboxylase [Desulfobulbus propionicus DSM 2032]|jgi:orotidine-5'-phosphate decarboxylase|uniref:Orotidine 5'-phosphate decarboxylase n=1 Tax=Desulfobulbus propionicus (strain ATCC 33891 / DSM 2032 / VKM B-1956 / 1pr3) TaxID=577650 RepID=A0A7U3YJY6_DESPD|nr:orotidine-5'-phosphate decarboxylase [Desulfobulbus propionicus]ADW16769.1 orotidine-5'-phosphate decarboxylase [Desulfobulbus propionicus DSM 2032]